MAPTETKTAPRGETRRTRPASGAGAARERRGQGGWFQPYKVEQGRRTRTGTFVGAGLLIAWGAKFLNDRLAGFQGDEAWRLMITPGIPILFAVVMAVVAWRLTYVSRGPSDFLIATEGEMKKVSWSTKREIIGSTKVVIVFTVLMALFLFVVDVIFKAFFSYIGVLKV